VGASIMLVVLWSYGQYFKARSENDKKDEKADVETLFGCKK